MQLKYRVTLLCVLTIFAMAVGASTASMQETRIQTLLYAGESRSYWIYEPQGLTPGASVPALLVLHGSAGTGEDMMIVTKRGFEKLADQEKFFVVYPNALERRWNEQGGTVDDAGFLTAIVDQLATTGRVDRKRVYIAGISSGGMMAQRMACEKSNAVAAVATVAGTMPAGMKEACKPERPTAILIIHGTEDLIVPWKGGAVAGFAEFGSVLSARETFEFWRSVNQCSGGARTSMERDRDPQDGTRVQTESYDGCYAAVTLVTVQGGGHTWPGGFQYLPERFIGKTSRDFEATGVIWDFFKRRAD